MHPVIYESDDDPDKHDERPQPPFVYDDLQPGKRHAAAILPESSQLFHGVLAGVRGLPGKQPGSTCRPEKGYGASDRAVLHRRQ